MTALHLVGLPHTTLTDAHLTCAYSQKVRRAAGMFRAEGYHVTVYGPDDTDADCDEHVVIATADDRERWGFGGGFDTATTPFEWDAARPYWRETNERAAAAIRERARPDDLLLLTTSTQAPIADAVPVLTVAEWTVGYEGAYDRERWFAAYESHAWRNHVYGIKGWRNGRAFDTVIPNFFNPDDFHPVKQRRDSLLFLGRVVRRKGLEVAVELANATGRRLIVAGPGGTQPEPGVLILAEGDRLTGDIEYVGEVGQQERGMLLASAAALIVPTLYLEPFGGVAVEAMLSGTPVVASDWGVFPETVIEGETGARFSTLQQAVDALDRALTLNGRKIREHAIARYSTAAVGPRYTEWFGQLDSLWREGWYERRVA